MACAERPPAFGEQAWAELPFDTRLTLIAWARALGLTAEHHNRLVNYLEPGSCPD